MHKIESTIYIYCPIVAAAQIFLIYSWLSNLPKTDSFFSVYCLFAVCGICCLFDNYNKKTFFEGSCAVGILSFATVFSISVILGNYAIFKPFTALMSLFNMGLCFLGGVLIGANILCFILNHVPLEVDETERSASTRFFVISFLSIVVIDLLYLFTTNYPAIIHYDTLAQFRQILELEAYSNWTPYFHTKTIECFFNIGYFLFDGSVDMALAFYEVCQVIFIAACFSYALVTLYQLGIPKLALGVAYCLYALLPYNIVFNVTIGKDILFGVGLLLMLTGLLRIITRTGRYQVFNYTCFTIGSFGFALWRTNGWYAYLVTACVLFMVRNKRKYLLFVMVLILAVSWLLINPWLESQNVPGSPVTEIFSVPFQQIARVIVNERELSESDAAFLSEIFHLDRVKELYTPESADPMKFYAFRSSNTDFFREHITDFISLWARLGIKYPGDYLLGWVDVTRGYWNGGYNMGVYNQGIPDNTMGMYCSGNNSIISQLFAAYFRYIEDPIILEPLKSIGFVVWVVLACWWVNIIKKRKVSVLAVPLLVILIGLWLGTPVFAEFRYAYPVFLLSPIIIITTIYKMPHQYG